MAVAATKMRTGCVVLAATLSCAAGCGRPKTYPVSGSVYVAGKPAAGAIVVLHPAATGPEAKRATGRVADDGTFKLGTYDLDDGALPGEYAVAIAWFSERPESGPNSDVMPTKLSPAYANPHTSKLNATITPGVNVIPRFDLSK